jgi:anti-sigma factor RsiW
MICRQLKFDAFDFARGVPLDPSRQAAVESHLRSCASCGALVERQRAVSAALRRLASEQELPALNAGRLQRLLAAMGQPPKRSRRATVAVGLSLAASVLIVASFSVGLQREAPPSGTSRVVAAALAPIGAEEPVGVAQGSPERSPGTAFVVLAGADALPRLESGRVIRVEIPAPEGMITADVLVGQDGLARAVRVVQ